MKRNFYLLLLFGLIFSACSKTEVTGVANNTRTNAVTTRSETAKDPYALSAMQQAMNLLAVENPKIGNITLEPTDYYVRFLPADSIQMSALKNMNIQLFDHRLDIMPGNELWNAEEAARKSKKEGYDWIYAVVPVDFIFPEGIEYENIYGVFIQRQANSQRRTTTKQLPDEIYQNVLRKSQEITGNITPQTRAIREWQPSAKLSFEIYDTILPIPGVTVRVYNYTYNENEWRATTNSKGETGPICTIDASVGYEIIWENPKWELRLYQRDKVYVTTHPTISYINTPYNTTFNNRTFEGVLAAYHRGLYAYYYESYPLTRNLTVFSKRMFVGITDEKSDEKWQGSYVPGILLVNPLRVFTRDSDNTMYSSQDAISLIIHELGHASHHEIKGILNYGDSGYTRPGESWANGVEYAYMMSMFPNIFTPKTNPKCEYTRLVECLLKNGLSFEAVQTGFRRAGTYWEDWRDELKKLNIIDNDFIQLIFDHPNDMTFDMRDVIDVQFDRICKGQPVWFSLKGDAANFCTVTKWEVVGDQTGVTEMANKNTRASYRFSTSGTKTIRATVLFPDNYRKVYEKTVTVTNLNVMIKPEGKLYTFNDIKIAFQPEKHLDNNVNVLRWWAEEVDGKCTWSDDIERYATFKFSTPGYKTIKVTLDYPLLEPQEVTYECTIYVDALPIENSFAIIDKPDYFSNGQKYEAHFINDGQPIYNITKVDINHFYYLPYLQVDWEYDKTLKKLAFRLPSIAVTVDYMLTIYYKPYQNSQETRVANLIVSNYQ